MMGCTCSCNSCNHYPEGHKIPPARNPQAPIVTQPGRATGATQQGKPISKTKALNDGLDIAAKVKKLFTKSNKGKSKQKPTSKDDVKGGKGPDSNKVNPGEIPDRNDNDDAYSDRVKTDGTEKDRDRQDYDDDSDYERGKTNGNDNDRDRQDYDDDSDDHERVKTNGNDNDRDRQ